jgi:hypothetical protein
MVKILEEKFMSDLAPEMIAVLNEFGESEAWANYYLCVPAEFVNKFRLEVKRIGSVCLTVIPKLDWTFFNRIVGLGVGNVATESMLDDIIAILQKAGCKNYMAQVSPLAEPAQLPEWLNARGFTRGRNWAKVYRGNEPDPSILTDLRVETIGGEHADAYADIALAAFEMPPELRPLIIGNVGKPGWHHYLAFDGEQPVSAAAMFVSGDVGWLGFGSTLESHRKHGGQGAMFTRRIKDGLVLGCKWFVTEAVEDTPESPNPSYHNMLRAGFELAYLRPNYVHQPPTS